jgi:hypothetical protein
MKREEGNAVVAIVTTETTMDDKIMAFLSGDDTAAENTADFETRCVEIAEFLRAEESRKAEETAKAAERMKRLEALRSGVKTKAPDTDVMTAAVRCGVAFDGERVSNLVRLYEVIHKAQGGSNPRTTKSTDSATISRVAVAVQAFMADAGKPDMRDLKSRKAAIASHFDHCSKDTSYGKSYVHLIWQ